MQLEGSCQCGKVRFRVDSETPYPFMYCYCSICRKTTGGIVGCNIMGKRDTLNVKGKKHLQLYHARITRPGKKRKRSKGERWFCKRCGTHLYVLDDRWPEGVWPNAGAIDTPLPVPPERVHMMLGSKPEWVPVVAPGPRHAEFPDLSIADWHAQHGLRVKAKQPSARVGRKPRLARVTSQKPARAARRSRPAGRQVRAGKAPSRKRTARPRR
jgi:hypothetical protein